jgi:hypothetical protein
MRNVKLTISYSERFDQAIIKWRNRPVVRINNAGCKDLQNILAEHSQLAQDIVRDYRESKLEKR